MDLLTYKLNGYCCSQIIMKECLDKMGKENQELVDASAAFCYGLGVKANCGIVTSALAAMYLYDPEEAANDFGPYFIEWFTETFGSMDCETLLEGGNPMVKIEKCTEMVVASQTKIEELMGWDND